MNSSAKYRRFATRCSCDSKPVFTKLRQSVVVVIVGVIVAVIGVVIVAAVIVVVGGGGGSIGVATALTGDEEMDLRAAD